MKTEVSTADDETSTDEGISPEHVIAGVALLTSLIAILSFTYDWGYFTALGVTFATAPTSIADHIRSGLVLASIAIPMWWLFFAADLFLLRVENGRHFDEWIANAADPVRARIWVAAARIGPVLLILGILLWLTGAREDNNAAPASGLVPTILAAAFFSLWPMFMWWAFKKPSVEERFSPLFRAVATVVPRYLVLFAWLGFIMAKMHRDTTSPAIVSIDHACQAEVETCPKGLQARVYRTFEEWFLVGDSSRAYWVRSAHVDRIQVPERGTSPSFLCALSGKACAVPEDEGPPGPSREESASASNTPIEEGGSAKGDRSRSEPAR